MLAAFTDSSADLAMRSVDLPERNLYKSTLLYFYFLYGLTTRTCNHSTDLFLTFNLVFNPGFLYYLGYKNIIMIIIIIKVG